MYGLVWSALRQWLNKTVRVLVPVLGVLELWLAGYDHDLTDAVRIVGILNAGCLQVYYDCLVMFMVG